MQVDLERVGPVGRRARLSGALAILGPVAALAIVVAAAGIPRLLVADAPIATPPPGMPGTVTSENPLESVAPDPVQTVPRHAWNLTVQSVPELLAERRTGIVRGGLVAVVGMLSQDPRAERCAEPDRDLTAAFCHRTALLEAEEAPGSTWTSTSIPHLHPRILPGTAMPPHFAGSASSAIRSIVIGRFTEIRPPACPDGTGRCRDEFILERLAWAGGDWIDRILVRDPRLLGAASLSSSQRIRAIASRETDRMEQILSIAVVRAGWLAELDANAARAAAQGAAAGGVTEGPVWYLRSVGRPITGQAARLTWAVIHHESGLVLASGTVDPG